MEKSKISAYQAFSLLFLCRMFDVITYSPIANNNTEGTLSLITGAISLFCTVIIAIPIVVFYSKYSTKDMDIIDSLSAHNMILGQVCYWIFFISITLTITFSVILFSDFLLNTIESFSKTFVIITILTATIYAASLNIEGISRASSIIMLFFIISIALIIFACMDAINPVNIKPVIDISIHTILHSILGTVTRNIELLGLILLFPKIKNKFKKTTFLFITISGLVGLLIWWISVLILGDYIYTQVYPFLTVSSILEIGNSIQRLDGLYSTIWIVVAFVKITFYLVLLKNHFNKILPVKHQKHTMFFVCATIVTALVAFSTQAVFKDFLHYPLFTGIPIITSVFFIPLIAITVYKYKSKN